MLDAKEISVAVIHSSIEVGSRVRNIAKIERIIERLNESGGSVDLAIVPQMINGIPLYSYPTTTKRFKRTAETIPGTTTQQICTITNKYNKHLLVGPILERRGTKLHRSAFLAMPVFGVKGVVRQLETFEGYSSTIETPILDMGRFKIGVVIAEDILYPEISLLLNLSSIDFLIFYPSLDINLNKQKYLAMMRAIETGCTTIMIGGTVTRRGEVLLDVPTMAVDESGDVIEELVGAEDRVLLVKIGIGRGRGVLSRYRRNVLVKLRRLLSYFIK